MPQPKIACRAIALLLALTSATAGGAAEAPAPEAERLVAAAIAHHNPEGAWPGGVFRLVIDESRPDGSGRETRVTLGAGRFALATERDGDRIEATVTGEACEVTVNGAGRDRRRRPAAAGEARLVPRGRPLPGDRHAARHRLRGGSARCPATGW